MDIEKIRKLLDELAAFMKRNDLAELEIDIDGAEIKLRKTGTQVHHQVVTHHAAPAAPAQSSTQPAAQLTSQPAAVAPSSEVHEQGTITVKSPMVGTFYRSSKPDSDHLVEVGDQVHEDTVLCIIEAMKVMNEIKAEHKGRIAKVLTENGEPVEYGQPLFAIVVDQ